MWLSIKITLYTLTHNTNLFITISPTRIFADKLASNNFLIYIFLTGVTLVMRSMILTNWSLDSDETTYAVIADHMLNGAILYKDVIDIKQPGIFLIFALIQIIFGKSMLVIRLITVLFISGSAFLLYRAKRQLQFGFDSSMMSAITFILMFNFYFGFPSNCEVFFIFFTSLGVYLFLTSSNHFHYFAAGLIFGLAFIIKQLAIFDFAAVGLFFLFSSIIRGEFRNQFSQMSVMVIGFLTPFAIVNLVFLWSGYYDYYHFITYIAPGNYLNPKEWSTTSVFVIKGLIVYLPFIILAIISCTSKEWRVKTVWLITGLLFFDLVAVSFTGMSHPHYYLQLAYPVSFAAGTIMSVSWVKELLRKKYTISVLGSLTIVYFTFLFYYYYQRYTVRPNYTKNLAIYVEDIIPEEATLYTGDAPQFLYWYLNKTSPTPYIHSTLLLQNSHLQTLEVDAVKELNRIYNTKPDFIILSENYKYPDFKDQVTSSYQLAGQQGPYMLYRNKLLSSSANN